ncbi:MAG: SDR family NAD(P)-dependent oxidoreductase [Nevskiales bacterium]|nr:SDR family NAD(P)-dependent oxidoreductase [Nevskiales bacterium]
MKDLKGKTAVVTGAASGIGRELALLCAQEGMHTVLADVDENGLRETAGLLPPGARHTEVKCDVARPDSVERLAEQTYATFGAAHLLFNNAGVSVGGPAWTATPEDWKWVFDVNLMGVAYGIRSFVPRMLKQGDECHVVNTASAAGLVSTPGVSLYTVSKHAVVALSECLHHDLQLARASIRVSVLCPAFTNTRIVDSARNRPADLAASGPASEALERRLREAVRKGRLSAADVARCAVDAVKADRFYILTHPAIKGAVETRLRDILEERLPTNPMP